MVAGSRVTPRHSIAMYHLLMFTAVLIYNVNPSSGATGGRAPDRVFFDVEDAVGSLGDAHERRHRDDVANRCHSSEKLQREDHSRYPRHARGMDTGSAPQDEEGGGLGRALYFTAESDLLLYKRISDAGFMFPRQRFTMELWVKPEGGQSSPAVIAGMCNFSMLLVFLSIYDPRHPLPPYLGS